MAVFADVVELRGHAKAGHVGIRERALVAPVAALRLNIRCAQVSLRRNSVSLVVTALGVVGIGDLDEVIVGKHAVHAVHHAAAKSLALKLPFAAVFVLAFLLATGLLGSISQDARAAPIILATGQRFLASAKKKALSSPPGAASAKALNVPCSASALPRVEIRPRPNVRARHPR